MFPEIINQKCLFFFRYIYVADIIDHDIDVFERQEGEQLVHLKVIQCFLIFFLLPSAKKKKKKHRKHAYWLFCQELDEKSNTILVFVQ